MKAQIHIVKEQPSLFWMKVTAKALYLNNTGKEIDIVRVNGDEASCRMNVPFHHRHQVVVAVVLYRISAIYLSK